MEDFAIRRTPVALDITVFIAQVVIFLSFFYFAYFYDLDKHKCYAGNGTDIPLATDSDIHGVDVARRFKMAIRFGFWMSFINAGRAALAQVAFFTKKW